MAFFILYRAQKGQPESKCPELLANYCDMLLRKTPLSRKLISDEIEKRLRDLVSISVAWVFWSAWEGLSVYVKSR